MNKNIRCFFFRFARVLKPFWLLFFLFLLCRFSFVFWMYSRSFFDPSFSKVSLDVVFFFSCFCRWRSPRGNNSRDLWLLPGWVVFLAVGKRPGRKTERRDVGNWWQSITRFEKLHGECDGAEKPASLQMDFRCMSSTSKIEFVSISSPLREDCQQAKYRYSFVFHSYEITSHHH